MQVTNWFGTKERLYVAMWVDFRALNKTTYMIVEGDIWKKALRSKKAPLHALTSYVFHLVIRYKKDFYDKVVDMLTRPIVSALVIFKHNPIMHKSYLEQYALDVDGKMFMQLYVMLTKLRNWIPMCMVNFCILASYVFHRVKEST
jgi:hypothetical protein